MDNQKIVEAIINNIKNSALPYFENFDSLENGIRYLMQNKNDGNFLKIFDLLLLNEEIDVAIDFFDHNNSWFEIELQANNDESFFGMNYKSEYLLRKNKCNELKNSR